MSALFLPWLFAQVDGMVTLIILGIFAMMSLINSNYRVLQVLLAMVIGGAGTISYLAFNYDALQLPTLYWLFLQSLSLYIVYLSFRLCSSSASLPASRLKEMWDSSLPPSTLSDIQELSVYCCSRNFAARISIGWSSITSSRDGRHCVQHCIHRFGHLSDATV